MNGQQRNSGFKKDYSQINIVKQVQVLNNYRKYKKVFCIRAFANTYLGYLDDDFFGFTVKEDNSKYWLMTAEEAVDYYENRTFFHNPVLEYDTFSCKPEFKVYLNALNMVKDKDNKNG